MGVRSKRESEFHEFPPHFQDEQAVILTYREIAFSGPLAEAHAVLKLATGQTWNKMQGTSNRHLEAT
jgi:hypothetical protein